MRLYKNALLGGVAALALGGFTVGMTSTADAFDNKNWTWNLDIDTDITETVNIDINIDPVGKVLDEVMQIQIGDVYATSTVYDIYNVKPKEVVPYTIGTATEFKSSVNGAYALTYDGVGSSRYEERNTHTTTDSFAASLDGSLVTESEDGPAGFIGGAGLAFFNFSAPPLSGSINGNGVIFATGAAATNGDASFDADLSGSLSKTHEEHNIYDSNWSYNGTHNGSLIGHLDVSASYLTTVYELSPKIQDALTDLPKVAAVSTAIGNAITIETDTPVQESSLQVLFDDVDHYRRPKEGGEQQALNGGGHHVNFEDADFDLDADLSLQDQKYNLDSGNYNHDVALLLGLAAGAGLIEQADIKADASVYNILNAQVNSQATAIGNLKSIDVATAKFDNGLVLADVTQLSVANVSADAKAYNIGLVNYTNLGQLTDPVVKATATAIGNTLSIKVNSSQGVPPTTP